MEGHSIVPSSTTLFSQISARKQRGLPRHHHQDNKRFFSSHIVKLVAILAVGITWQVVSVSIFAIRYGNGGGEKSGINIDEVYAQHNLPPNRTITPRQQRDDDQRGNGSYSGPFDLVYLWANNTLDWSKQKNSVMTKLGWGGNKTWSPTRDNNELKLSIRSVEKYLPWIRNIYILSNGQTPSWIDINHPRLRILHSDKLIDMVNGTSPNFNSHALYLATAFIPNISEIYLQMDDDFIIGQPLTKDMFYRFGHEINALISWADRNDLPNQKNLLKQLLPNYKPKWAAHMPRCWNKTRVKKLWELHTDDVVRTVNNQLRMNSDIDLTSFYGPFSKVYYNNPLVMFDTVKQTLHADGLLLDIGQNDSFPLHHYGKDIQNFISKNLNNLNRPALVCLQDAGDAVGLGDFSKLSRAFGVGPSSFELHQFLPHAKTKVFGHRGIGYPLPNEEPILENTIESISAALKAGLRWVEIDVGVTLDMVIIVGHFHTNLYEDCDVIDKKLLVSETKYEELATQSKKYGLPAPAKLFDVLSKFKGKLGFQIELKQDTNYGLGRLCNKAVANGLYEKRCNDRSVENDNLLHQLLTALEDAEFPENDIIISSFEAPRLHNFRNLGSRFSSLKLVGGQNEGVGGMIKICQKYLGQNASVSIPLQFANQKRVRELRDAGIMVEIGLPGAAHCLSYKPQKQIDLSVTKRQMTEALSMQPDSICTDFPRDAEM